MRTWRRSRLVGWLALALALTTSVGIEGCDEARAPSEPNASDPEPAPRAPGTAAGEPGASSAEPRVPAGDDAACVARLAAALPSELGLLLDDLGYHDALDEACAAERAVRVGDASACGELSASGLRAGCQRRLAVTHARPDMCPRLGDVGREPVCLAWAARAPARCAAAVGSEALLCRAPFERNAQLCRELGAELPRCEAAIARYGELLVGSRARALPPVEGDLRASFSAFTHPASTGDGDGRTDEPELVQPTDLSLARGVYIAREGCVATLHLAPARNTLAHPRVVGVAPLRIRLGALRGALRDVRLSAEEAVRLGLRPVVGAPPVQALAPDDASALVGAETTQVRGEVRVDHIDPVRGGEVRLALDLRVAATGGTYRLRGQLATFARDVDPIAPECADAEPESASPARRRRE